MGIAWCSGNPELTSRHSPPDARAHTPAPMVLSNMLQSMSGTVNGIYIGQMLGVGAAAAAATFFPLMFFFIAFIIGLGAGSSVLIGQA